MSSLFTDKQDLETFLNTCFKNDRRQEVEDYLKRVFKDKYQTKKVFRKIKEIPKIISIITNEDFTPLERHSQKKKHFVIKKSDLKETKIEESLEKLLLNYWVKTYNGDYVLMIDVVKNGINVVAPKPQNITGKRRGRKYDRALMDYPDFGNSNSDYKSKIWDAPKTYYAPKKPVFFLYDSEEDQG